MVLVAANPARLEFSRRSSLGASLFTSVWFVVLAALPLLAPGRITGARGLFSLVLFLIAGAFYAYGRPRARAVRIELDRGRIDFGSTSVPLAGAHFVALSTGGSPRDSAFRTRYRAELVLEGGERVIL